MVTRSSIEPKLVTPVTACVHDVCTGEPDVVGHSLLPASDCAKTGAADFRRQTPARLATLREDDRADSCTVDRTLPRSEEQGRRGYFRATSTIAGPWGCPKWASTSLPSDGNAIFMVSPSSFLLTSSSIYEGPSWPPPNRQLPHGHQAFVGHRPGVYLSCSGARAALRWASESASNTRQEACTILQVSGLFDGTPLERPVTCEVCEQPSAQCACPRSESGAVLLPKDQSARVGREKRRKGKTVTVITGLNPVVSNLDTILAKLKSACAAGGTISPDRIEIQGDHRERALSILRDLGYPAKLSGG